MSPPSVPFPNAILGGAPKCGTSSVFRWLADHPQVCGSKPKETFFLVDEGHDLLDPETNVHRLGMEGYRRFFGHYAGEKIRIEGTTHYLYQKTAPRVLGLQDPVPHILFLLRHPSDRLYSSFRYTKNNLAALPAEMTFSEYVELSERGVPVTDLPGRYDTRGIWRRDVQYGQYVDYLERWRNHVPLEKLTILVFERLRRNPLAAMKQIAGILGIAPTFYDAYGFPRHNETVQVKHAVVHRRALRAGRWLPRGPLRSRLRRAYRALLTRDDESLASDDRRVLEELDERYEPYNRRLSAEFGIDLSDWDRHARTR